MVLGAVIEAFPLWIALVPCLLVAAGAVVCSIAADMARDEVERLETAQTVQTQLIASLRVRSKNLTAVVRNEPLKKELEQLAEAFRYSDPVSSPNIAGIEQQLTAVFASLEQAVSSGNIQNASVLCRNCSSILAQRNAACKLNK